MFGLSTSHLLIVGFIALLFGSRRLPELGSSLGSAIRAFKTAVEGRAITQTTDLAQVNKPTTPIDTYTEVASGEKPIVKI